MKKKIKKRVKNKKELRKNKKLKKKKHTKLKKIPVKEVKKHKPGKFKYSMENFQLYMKKMGRWAKKLGGKEFMPEFHKEDAYHYLKRKYWPRAAAKDWVEKQRRAKNPLPDPTKSGKPQLKVVGPTPEPIRFRKERKSGKLSAKEAACKLIYNALVKLWNEFDESKCIRVSPMLTRVTEKRVLKVKEQLGKHIYRVSKGICKYMRKRGVILEVKTEQMAA